MGHSVFSQSGNKLGDEIETLWLLMDRAKEYDVVLLQFGLDIFRRREKFIAG